ncbi:hypothetical protein AGMMS50268_39440 [Spirochaetia bacterium]|nr:hypothetical protein AGMMS50268_39440 [Spirochaetia bacterium]
MKKYFFIIPILLVFFSGCEKNTPRKIPEVKTPLPELGININLPEGFVPVAADQLAAMQADNRAAEPVPPLADFPCYVFVNSASGAAVSVSRLTPMDTADNWMYPTDFLFNYHQNLEDHFDINIPADDITRDDYRLLLLHINVITEQAQVALDKGLYYNNKQDQYFMIDLYSNKELMSAADIEAYQKIFLSITTNKMP